MVYPNFMSHHVTQTPCDEVTLEQLLGPEHAKHPHDFVPSFLLFSLLDQLFSLLFGLLNSYSLAETLPGNLF